MKQITIKHCEDCPFFERNFMDPCECSHDDAPKKAYMNSVGPGDKPPKWCPIRKKGGSMLRISRDSNDRIKFKTKLIIG